jgi:glycerol-3-phosphate O-acyltransferase/dihydroxyacetone phosphate acyltransferase
VTALALALLGPTLVVLWTAGLVDVARRRDLRRRAKALWAAAILGLPTAGAVAYALARPLPVERTIVGAPAEGVGPVPAGVRRRGAQVVQQLARFAARGLFRSVEVLRPASVRTDGPQLWAASHFGAFSDPIVLLHALERQPRFLAGAFLFRPPVSWLLRAAGAIPVARRQDGAGDNRGMFAASRASLHAGDALCIFPEGVVSPTTSMAPLRTGAARIALGARGEGTAGLQLVPVGIHYQDRAALRRRVFVDVGEPLDLDRWLRGRGLDPDDPASASEDDHELVRALTADLDARLRLVAPEFTDLEEAVALHAAASVALRSPDAPDPSWARRADLADALGRCPDPRRSELLDAVAAYRDELEAVGLTDRDLIGRPRRSRQRVLLTALAALLLAPVVLVAAVIHLPLLVLIKAVGRLDLSVPTKATVQPVVAMLGAVVTWGVGAWVLTTGVDGWERAATGVVWLVVLPAWGAAAVLVAERASLLVTALRRRAARGRVRRDGNDAFAELEADRRRVVTLVTDVLDPSQVGLAQLGPSASDGDPPGGANA